MFSSSAIEKKIEGLGLLERRMHPRSPGITSRSDLVMPKPNRQVLLLGTSSRFPKSVVFGKSAAGRTPKPCCMSAQEYRISYLSLLRRTRK